MNIFEKHETKNSFENIAPVLLAMATIACLEGNDNFSINISNKNWIANKYFLN
jgi:hypothetical protein